MTKKQMFTFLTLGLLSNGILFAQEPERTAPKPKIFSVSSTAFLENIDYQFTRTTISSEQYDIVLVTMNNQILYDNWEKLKDLVILQHGSENIIAVVSADSNLESVQLLKEIDRQLQKPQTITELFSSVINYADNQPHLRNCRFHHFVGEK